MAVLHEVMRGRDITTLDFIVLTRWVMAALAECQHPAAWVRVKDADARVSEYVLRCIAIAGDPIKNWSLVAPELRVNVVRTYHAREMIARKQWADSK